MHAAVRTVSGALAIALAVGLVGAKVSRAQGPEPAVRYTADGKLEYPKDYRSWVYLSSGMDMSYSDTPGMGDMHMFDNVFVDRPSYEVFQKTGTWPNKTIFMLEVRKGVQKGSINKKGMFQDEVVMGREAHVKDTARFKSGWAFFPFGGGQGASKELPQTSGCNTCHEQHAAVDTTFVQFYPTLIETAQKMKTFSPAYLAEEAKAKEEKR